MWPESKVQFRTYPGPVEALVLFPMLKSIFFILLFATGSNALAEWVMLGTSKVSAVYGDPETIHRAGNIATMWVLHNFHAQQESPEGELTLSVIVHEAYNCKNMRSRSLRASGYSEYMGRGNIVRTVSYSDDAEFLRVEAKSAAEALLNYACARQRNDRPYMGTRLGKLRWQLGAA